MQKRSTQFPPNSCLLPITIIIRYIYLHYITNNLNTKLFLFLIIFTWITLICRNALIYHLIKHWWHLSQGKMMQRGGRQEGEEWEEDEKELWDIFRVLSYNTTAIFVLYVPKHNCNVWVHTIHSPCASCIVM